MISKSSLYVLTAFTALGLAVSGLVGALFPHDYGSPETPFGVLSASTPASRNVDAAQIPHVLQLAPQPAANTIPLPQPAPVLPRDVMVAPSAPVPKPVDVVAERPAAAGPPPNAAVADAAPPVLPPTVLASNAPIVPLAVVASPVSADRSDAEAPATAPDRPGSSSDAIDINKAPVEVLNHLPGMGMIGRTIVRHRPYRSIQDLVDKRVLRFSAFQKLKSRIKVD